jgi:hypothetical protein
VYFSTGSFQDIKFTVKSLLWDTIYRISDCKDDRRGKEGFILGLHRLFQNGITAHLYGNFIVLEFTPAGKNATKKGQRAQCF